jgi:hyperosmotically inducible protein
MTGRLIGALLMLVTAAAPAVAQREDLQIFRDVQKQVLRYPHFTIYDSVHAGIEGGVVVLTGKVTMPYKRNALERRVRGVDGVERVENRIEVLPASKFDDELRYAIARAIYSNPAFREYAYQANPPIHVIVERGRVTLEGVVNSEVDRMLARSIASSFVSFELKNELKTVAEAEEELEKI